MTLDDLSITYLGCVLLNILMKYSLNEFLSR